MLNGKKKKEIEVHRSMGGYKVEARKEEKKKKNSHVDFQLTTLVLFISLFCPRRDKTWLKRGRGRGKMGYVMIDNNHNDKTKTN